MWIKITSLYFPFNLAIEDINKIVTCTNHRMRLLTLNSSSHHELYTNDPVVNIIIHHYIFTKHHKNRLIDLKKTSYSYIDVYLNSDMIQDNIDTPVMNAILRKIQDVHEIHQCLDINNISILPRTIIDKSAIKLFTKKTDFNVKLFDYQKRNILRMIEIENDTNKTFDRNINITLADNIISWDPHYEKITTTNNIVHIKSKGGILADSMGLGKTISMLGLLNYGNKMDIKKYTSKNKIYTNATLIIVPSHLAKQWSDEFSRAFKKEKKIITILTKVNHDKITYSDFVDADMIVVTTQFLTNLKNYCGIHNGFSTPSRFSYDKRTENINFYYDTMIRNKDYKEMTQPLFEYFHFNRVVVDEGHEIMEAESMRTVSGHFIHRFIRDISAEFKWYISGTPFTTYRGLINIFNYLNVELIYENNEKIIINDFSHNHTSFTIYKNDSHTIVRDIYSYIGSDDYMLNLLGCIMVRHLKDNVKDSINLFGYKETIEWVELTEAERTIYDTKKNTQAPRITLQQLCCHPLIAESFKKIVGNEIMSLEDVQDKLIKHHTNVIKEYTKKIETLDKTNQAYHMLLANYTSKVTESKYILGMLEKVNNTIEADEENNCIICYDEMTEPTLTPCGHIFCKGCIITALNIKNECPICKNNVTVKELMNIKAKEDKPIVKKEANPLIEKYGSKLGKLIMMVRTCLAQDGRIIIFSQWDEMLLMISKSLAENGVNCSFITGNVYKRTKAISKFKMGGDNSVILLSLNNSASGTNLTEATHIFFVEPIDNTKENIVAIEGQAIGRAVRLGQKQKTEIIRILCKDTIEDEIYNAKYCKV